MKLRLVAALVAAALSLSLNSMASAQNVICPPMPIGNSSSACASTQFVQQNLQSPTNLSSSIDAAFGSARGSILERGATGWAAVPPGTSGLPWVSNGPSADPAYQPLANSGLAQMLPNTVKCNPTSGSAGAQDCTYTPGCVTMTPQPSQSTAAWRVIDAYGNPVPTSGTQTQGLQEAINFSVSNGQCLRVYGQGTFSLGSQSATLNSTTTVTGLTSTAALLVGDFVTSPNGAIPPFTRIASIDSSSQIHISNAATVTATRTLTFTRGAGPNLNTQISAGVGITIPPVEQWSAHFYDVNLTFAPSVTGPGLTFDSAIIMDFNFQGGQIVYQPTVGGASSYPVLLSPQNPVPLDGNVQISGSRIHIQTIAAPAASGTNSAVLGLNCSVGSILNNYIAAEELNGTGTGSVPNTQNGILLFGASANSSCEQNTFDVTDIHLVSAAGVSDGNSSTNQTHYNGNIYRVNVRPGSAAQCFATWGTAAQFYGTCTNEEAGGNVAQGLSLQAGSIGTVAKLHMTGVTSRLAGTGTKFDLNFDGDLFIGAGGSSGTVKPAGIIAAQVANAGTGADTTEDTLQTFTIPANAFDVIGRGIRIEAWGTVGADANSKTVRLYFGSAVIYNSTAITANGVSWYMWATVFQTGTNTQTAVATSVFGNSTPNTVAGQPNQTTSATITVKVTGQNGTAVTNDILCGGMTITFLN